MRTTAWAKERHITPLLKKVIIGFYRPIIPAGIKMNGTWIRLGISTMQDTVICLQSYWASGRASASIIIVIFGEETVQVGE
jgi:hypothetical protein